MRNFPVLLGCVFTVCCEYEAQITVSAVVGLAMAAFLFLPVGVAVGGMDSGYTVIFRGEWAWIGKDFSSLEGGRGCVHVGMLAIELAVLMFGAVIALLAPKHKHHRNASERLDAEGAT